MYLKNHWSGKKLYKTTPVAHAKEQLYSKFQACSWNNGGALA